MFILSSQPDNLTFPPVDLASPEGLLAIGGDLRCERLLEAYRQGIFPWYSDGQPILWWSPDPRAILLPSDVHISRSLGKTLRQQKYRVTMDACFDQVIHACAQPRKNTEEDGTWILPEMMQAYIDLHQRGYAHSIEVWLKDELVGGLYGVSLGAAFFGESMFSRSRDASKVAMVYLAHQTRTWGFQFIDCQVSSDHLIRMGAKEIRRGEFMDLLKDALRQPDRTGHWQLDKNLTSQLICP